MVMLGGLTMWIDPKSVPARVSMGKTAINLLVVTLVRRYNNGFDHINNHNGIEVFVAACILPHSVGYLPLDLLLLRLFRRSRVLCFELFDGA